MSDPYAAEPQPGPTPSQLSQLVRQRATELGFHAVGFAPAGPADPDNHLKAWLKRGFGEMGYMARTVNERQDPRLIVEDATSVIALAHSYYQPEVDPSGPLKVSRYAVGSDYHNVIRKKIRKLRKHIIEHAPNAIVKPTVDTSPILEREWAKRAGIAWIGKSTMAIHPRLGTYTFLATLVTNLHFTYDVPLPDRCGSCTRCIDACPPQAFEGPYQLNATKCITYWNVEHQGDFDENTPNLAGWVAGCDVCQEVCPWNKFARPTEEPRFIPRPGLTAPQPDVFAEDAKTETLRSLLEGTALKRTGPVAIQRNARRILNDS